MARLLIFVTVLFLIKGKPKSFLQIHCRQNLLSFDHGDLACLVQNNLPAIVSNGAPWWLAVFAQVPCVRTTTTWGSATTRTGLSTARRRETTTRTTSTRSSARTSFTLLRFLMIIFMSSRLSGMTRKCECKIQWRFQQSPEFQRFRFKWWPFCGSVLKSGTQKFRHWKLRIPVWRLCWVLEASTLGCKRFVDEEYVRGLKNMYVVCRFWNDLHAWTLFVRVWNPSRLSSVQLCFCVTDHGHDGVTAEQSQLHQQRHSLCAGTRIRWTRSGLRVPRGHGPRWQTSRQAKLCHSCQGKFSHGASVCCLTFSNFFHCRVRRKVQPCCSVSCLVLS